MVRSMVMGVEGGEPEQVLAHDCLSARYHPAVPGTVVLAYPREVLLVDTDLGQTVGVIGLDRAHSPLAALAAGSTRDLLLLLHHSGSVSAWAPRPGLSVASTPLLPKSQSFAAFPPTPSAAASSSEAILEVTYEQRASSDSVRLGKNCKVLGLAVSPNREAEAAFVTTDGRLFLLGLRPAARPTLPSLANLVPSPITLTLAAIVPSLSNPPHAIRMCPPLTVKNWADFQPLMVVGSHSGHLLLVNVSTGSVERELAVHTAAVAGIEWTSASPAASVLSYACCPVTGAGGLVRNELVHTDLRTGRSRHLRAEAGREVEEERVTMLRVSQARQYFVIAFASAPFELWDLKKLCLLRTMPKKFPPITSLVWSPLHSTKGRRGSRESRESREESPAITSGKEHILLTDTVGQVYHFTVEGGSIKDGTKIPAEANIGTVVCLCWKADIIVRGDTEGNINVYNVKTRECKNQHTGKGAVRKLSFSPGKNNLKLLVVFAEWIQIWDARELDMINELREAAGDAEWASSDRVAMAGTDGAVRLAGLALAGTSSPALAYGREVAPACLGLLPSTTFAWVFHCLALPPTDPTMTTLDSLMAGLTEEQGEVVAGMLGHQGEGFIHKLDAETSVVKRQLIVSKVLGLPWEASLWQLLNNLSSQQELGARHGVLVGEGVFRGRQEERCRLHLSRAVERADRVQVTAQLICLGQAEPAVGLLLDCDAAEESYMADQLLACLIQATQATITSASHLSTVKMVATNLLSEGRLWEGVQLLALTGQVAEAVSYLRAAGHWRHALWLGRLRLPELEFTALLGKYCDFLVAEGRVREACLVHLATGRVLAAVEVLHLAQHRGLAARLLPLLTEQEEEGGVVSCLVEAATMETARMLQELGQVEAAVTCCRELGEKGRELVLELTSARAAVGTGAH